MKKFLLISFVLFTSFVNSYAEETPEVENTHNPAKIHDPWYGFNKRMYVFNYHFDQYVFLPVVNGYEYVMPDPAEKGVSNFFSNIGEITNFTNCLLQGKFSGAGKTLGRFAINTTVGVLGIFDWSTDMGIHRQNEDFGQTLAYYGVDHGPYLVLPFLGPSSVRDGSGKLVDSITSNAVNLYNFNDHNEWMWLPVNTLGAVDARHGNKFRYGQTGSPFEYELIRLLYYKSRKVEENK